MNRKILMIVLVAAMGFSVQTAFAGSKDQAVEKLMKVMKTKESIEKSLYMIMNMQAKAFQNNPAILGQMKAFYQKNIGWEAQKADIMNIYKELFTEKEIKDLIAFYETPTGKKMIDMQPEIQEKMMKLTMDRMQKHMPELQKIIMEAMQKKPPETPKK